MMAKNEVLVKAGIIAAQKWDIDPKEVNVMLVSSLRPFKIRKPLRMPIEDPKEITPLPQSDDIIFEQYNGVQWRADGFEFWLAWGPLTNTLAIYIRSMAQKVAGEMVRYGKD
jgi:hypothetical protein